VLENSATVKSHIERVLHGTVRPGIYPLRAPLEVGAHHVHGEPIRPAEAYQRRFEPFAVGQAWGARWDTTWFRLRGTIPSDWAGAEVVALVNLGGSGMVGFTAEGQIWDGEVPVQGLHQEHREHVLARSARGGEAVELSIEAAANPIPPWHLSDWPPLLPDPGGAPLYVLAQAEMAVVDREVEALWLDLRILLQLLGQVRDHPRHDHVLRALADAANAIDRGNVAETAKQARSLLAPVLAAPGSAGRHTVTAVGHAHIDTAWLWPVRETKRKCARTFSNQLRLLDEYPEHRFACSQAQQYQWMKDEYPSLWTRIKEKVAAGQWEPVGGMWVETDTNLPSGESLVRQLVHGKRFFSDEFGIETHELWIPDVFGYSAALPQIAAQAGVTAFITQKMSWNDMNPFPHHTFWWEGHDGSRLFTHFPPAATYNGDWQVHELVNSVKAFTDHGRSDRSLYPYGYGDGGGGPTRHMLEVARRVADLDGVPRIEIGTVATFLETATAEASDLGVWVGELYLEAHRATYTTQAEIKRANRRGEEALRAAELWSVAAVAQAGGDWSAYPGAELDRAGKLLLLQQFHDILPGSGISWVYDDARHDHAAVAQTTGAVIERAQRALADVTKAEALTVFNPASHHRTEVIELPSRGNVTDLALVSVPACGWAAVDRSAPPPDIGPVAVGANSIENAYLRVTWDGDGLLSSIWDKKMDREVLADRANVFQLHEDYPNAFDAWDVELTYLDKVTDLCDAASIEVVEQHPLRAGVRFVRRFGQSVITQTMRLAAGSRRIEFHTEVDWHERHRFLKVAFPVAIRSARATYEIQHGHIERPTVANTSWDIARFEVCAHRWADLSEAGYGVALLNDCKYGYDIRGNVMRLSLLRGPGYPDAEADQGQHRFAYALLPHPGDFRAPGGVISEAEAFNVALTIATGKAESTGQVVAVDRPGVSVEAVKKADRSDELVVRLCEVWGSRGPVRVTVSLPVSAVRRTDLLEREVGAPLALDGNTVTLHLRPFELVTLKFAPATRATT
jgi:alpha-mannosidase